MMKDHRQRFHGGYLSLFSTPLFSFLPERKGVGLGAAERENTLFWGGKRMKRGKRRGFGKGDWVWKLQK